VDAASGEATQIKDLSGCGENGSLVGVATLP
jgi:hypothetical protein